MIAPKTMGEILKKISDEYGSFAYCQVVDKKGHDRLLKDVRQAIRESFDAAKTVDPNFDNKSVDWVEGYATHEGAVAAAEAKFLEGK